MRRWLALAPVLLAALGACSDRPAAAPTDAWLGQWNGPEGT